MIEKTQAQALRQTENFVFILIRTVCVALNQIIVEIIYRGKNFRKQS